MNCCCFYRIKIRLWYWKSSSVHRFKILTLFCAYRKLGFKTSNVVGFCVVFFFIQWVMFVLLKFCWNCCSSLFILSFHTFCSSYYEKHTVLYFFYLLALNIFWKYEYSEFFWHHKLSQNMITICIFFCVQSIWNSHVKDILK